MLMLAVAAAAAAAVATHVDQTNHSIFLPSIRQQLRLLGLFRSPLEHTSGKHLDLCAHRHRLHPKLPAAAAAAAAATSSHFATLIILQLKIILLLIGQIYDRKIFVRNNMEEPACVSTPVSVQLLWTTRISSCAGCSVSSSSLCGILLTKR